VQLRKDDWPLKVGHQLAPCMGPVKTNGGSLLALRSKNRHWVSGRKGVLQSDQPPLHLQSNSALALSKTRHRSFADTTTCPERHNL